MDTKKQITKAFDRAAQTYDRVGPRFFSYFGRRLVDLAEVTAGSKVLDVATGTGAILLCAADQAAAQGRVIGIDLSKGMIERVRQEIGARGLTNSLVCFMDAEELGFQSASFDSVLCGFALDSFPHPDRAISEYRRVLQQGGRLGLTISSGWWWEGDERWRWHGELLRSLGVKITSGNRRFATRDEVEGDLRSAGFVHVSALKEEFKMVFADAETWWQWAWSHGYRRLLESMGHETLEQYRAACFKQLSRPSQTGGIHGRLEVLVAEATKPPSAR